ncbi:MAG: hypothetical protein HOQ24_04980, partial [Mycobacteriaceae bacterium]|nr:hypothetical protein [Mycobacteriaceae bacterium]
MGLRLPDWLPPVVLELAVGHFPLGDETPLRALASEWRRKAKRLRVLADKIEAASLPASSADAGQSNATITDEAHARAAELRDRAKSFDSFAAQLEDFADTIELMKLQVGLMAVVLAGQLAVDFLMAGGAGMLKAAFDRARTKTAMTAVSTQGLTRVATRAATDSVVRHAIPSPRKLLFMGAGMGVAFGAGAPLGAQAIQKEWLHHNTEKGYDWRSVGEGALSGLIGGLAGVEVVRRAAPRIGVFVNRAATKMSITNQLAVRAMGTGSAMLLGGVSGAAGAVLGTAILIPIPGTELTGKDWRQAVVTGFFGGAVGAGGSAMAGLITPPPPGAPHAAGVGGRPGVPPGSRPP